MKKKVPVFKSLVCAVSLALTVSIPALASTDRPVLPLPSADEIGPRCQQGLSDLGQQISALEKIQSQSEEGAAEFLKGWNSLQTVSYTHLDVYKRQLRKSVRDCRINMQETRL